MHCEPTMSLLTPPITFIFGGLFIAFSLVGTISNVIVLKILRRPLFKTQTNRILASLVLANIFEGLIAAPISAWQLFSRFAITNCYIDFLRRYIIVSLTGTSLLSLVIIAFDRCILLTRLNDYESFMTRRNCLLLVTFAWICPAVIPCLAFLGRYPYLAVALLVTLGSFVALILSFYFIKRAVKKHNGIMLKHQREATLYENTINNRYKEQQRRELVHVKLSRLVSLLIITNFCSMLLSNIWILVNIVETNYPVMNLKNHQLFYLVSLAMVLTNPCINPFILFLKHPEIKRELCDSIQRWKSH